MAVLAKVEAHTRPDTIDALRDLLEEILPDTRTFAGCLGLETWQNQDDPQHFILTERWEARADHEKYLAWRMETGVLQQIVALLDCAPDISYHDEVDV